MSGAVKISVKMGDAVFAGKNTPCGRLIVAWKNCLETYPTMGCSSVEKRKKCAKLFSAWRRECNNNKKKGEMALASL